MSASTRYELARRLADGLSADDGIAGSRVWLDDGSGVGFLPVISPNVNQVEDIVTESAAELQARGALGFGAGLKPVLGYVEIPQWNTRDPDRREKITGRIERAATAIGLAAAVATNASRRKILIADEDGVVRAAVRSVLRCAGYDVDEAVNGQEAIDKVRERAVDLVVMAWLLPVVDGKAAARELKGDPKTQHIPIVMLTKKTRIEDKVEALNVGVQDFITKPFDFRELIARIEQQVRWRALLGGAGGVGASLAQAEGASPQLEAVMALLDTHDFDGALKGAMRTAEDDERGGSFESAARAYLLASKAAEGARRPDLANELQRLSGAMFLRLAESANDTAKIQLGYTMAARMFLTAGSLTQAQDAAGRLDSQR